MDRIVSALSRAFGRVELLARGVDGDRRLAEEALAGGRLMEAHGHARALLQRVPESPIGLALLAQAAGRCGLHDEEARALQRLVKQAPWRSDLWLKLGQAQARAGHSEGRAEFERASHAQDPGVARQALLALADLEISVQLEPRATRWLDRIPQHPSSDDDALALRRMECALLRQDIASVETFAGMLQLNDGRSRLAAAKAKAALPDLAFGASALALASAAWVLDAKGAEATACSLLGQSRDLVWVGRMRQVASDKGVLDKATWQAAFALAEGREQDAQAALLDAVAQDDRIAAEELLRLAAKGQDFDLLAALDERAPTRVPEAQQQLLSALRLHRSGKSGEALDALAAVGTSRSAWSDRLEEHILCNVLEAAKADQEAWQIPLQSLRQAAAQLGQPTVLAHLERLAADLDRPLSLAVIGEFNAGKSTFLNALLGAEVAPMGVRPTTACLHRLAWAPDAFVRILTASESDRVVGHEQLRPTLKELEAQGCLVEQVFIYAPIEALRRAEILDTPGFNASDKSHARRARAGIEQADVALWLLDATSPLKNSERQVLESLGKSGVPLVVLVNKADRLDSTQLGKVMGYVKSALKEVAVRSIIEPIAFSARDALRRRTQDPQHASDDTMAQVENLLRQQVVDRQKHWRYMTMRRALKVHASQLASALASRAKDEEERRLDTIQKARETTAAANELLSQPEARSRLCEAVLDALAEPLRALRDDLAPLAAVLETEQQDPEVQSYRIQCTQERLVPAIAEVLHEKFSLDHKQSRELRAHLRSSLGGSAALKNARLAGEDLLWALEAALSSCALVLTEQAPIRQVAGGAEIQQRRLQALLCAFASTAASDAP